MLEPTGIAWVGLYAQSLPTLVDFYANRVGFRVLEETEHCCILDAGAGALFEIWGKGCAVTQGKSTKEQSMLVGFLVARLEPVVEALRTRGVNPDTEIDSYLGTRWIYYTDPEGNRFELKDRQG
ncbi:VOC family protein [Methylibium rhizosphaerae]|uniref:VOC family protein n=1 Tax=Methylibium rhizosphaerae TaxID=2570323 RepID=UPI00112ED1DA|nr:VOC family protein [Methylibium rhizosphaerae]